MTRPTASDVSDLAIKRMASGGCQLRATQGLANTEVKRSYSGPLLRFCNRLVRPVSRVCGVRAASGVCASEPHSRVGPRCGRTNIWCIGGNLERRSQGTVRAETQPDFTDFRGHFLISSSPKTLGVASASPRARTITPAKAKV